MNGERREAEPKLHGTCPNCDREVIAKCGQRRIWHWSHRGKLDCDHWWEPETEWHRSWKAFFPQAWQEVIHIAADGERHIADVKNDKGLVVELQHSPIAAEERLSRESFYERMVWVVDGMLYKRDLAAFRKAVDFASVTSDKQNRLILIPLTERAEIFRRWAPLQCPVFVDFGDEELQIGGFVPPERLLWHFLLDRGTGRVVVAPVTRASFIEFALNGSDLRYLALMRRDNPRRRYRARMSRF
ncbi:competence protein CoiA [Bosea robiniae]|uniref:competence protein CoiA n=1 Tax=Bosea robiniae TaxID=1036780 RepID=UPI00244E80F9|nr:competence protein CoiA family protein [Bosea robiniae]